MTLKWFSSYAPVDEEFGNVSLLLHGDGTNGSTTIVDSSSSTKAVTAFGDAQISTAQSKFGGASIAFDGNGDYLTIPPSAKFEFGTDPFTVEFWIYPTTSTAGRAVSVLLTMAISIQAGLIYLVFLAIFTFTLQ